MFREVSTTQTQWLSGSQFFTPLPVLEAKEQRTYGSRFFNSIQHEGKPQASDEFRLFVQGHD